MEIKSNISNFYAADSLAWVISEKDHLPSNNYVCRVILVNASSNIEMIATIDGDNFIINKTSVDTADFIPAKYKCFIVFSNSALNYVKQVDYSFIMISPDITTQTQYDYRTEAQKQLEVVNELLSGRLVDGVNAFSVNGRSVTLMTMTELMQVKSQLEDIVNNELSIIDKNATGKTNRNKLKVIYKGINL